MKKTMLKHLITLLLCFTMLGIFVLPTYATTAQAISFSGKITAPDDTVNLSDIEVKVYSAVFVEAEEESALDYFAETYAFSVYTNENGEFHFTKPTTYCSISVELSSLPSGYGISQRTQFIRPQRNEIAFTVSPIASIDTALSGDEIEVTLLNAAGDPILAEYTVNANDPAQDSHMSATEQDFQILANNLAGIDAMTSYTYSGTVTAPGFSAPYSETVDLSDLATDAKVNFLYAKGLLTEEQKMGYYCEILTSNQYTVSGCCGTLMFETLKEYINSGKARTNSALAQQIHDISIQSDEDMDAEYHAILPVPVDETDEDSFVFNIHYDPSDTTTTTKLQQLANEIIAVHQYFIGTNIFREPTSTSEFSSYDVYIVLPEDVYLESNGSTHPIGQSVYSTIRINNTLSVKDFKHTFAHEYHHAIQFTYGITSATAEPWVFDAFATMASLVYAGYDNQAETGYYAKIDEYVQNTHRSIFDTTVNDLFRYGALLYPLYLYETFSGWTTIRTIYQKYSTYRNIYAAIDACPEISSYRNAFLACSARNYSPSNFYSALSGSSVGAARPYTTSPINTYSNISMAPMSSRYYTFNGIIETMDLSFTIEVTGNGSGLMIDSLSCKWPIFNGTPTFSTISANVTRITFQQNNIGVGDCMRFVIIPVNTNISGSDIIMSIESS